MKYLILIVALLPFLLFPQSDLSKRLTIDKNNQGGFNIYNSSGDLLSEHTKKNTDSLTLETLNDIFFEADGNNRSEIAVINLQGKGFDWTTIVISALGLLGTLAGYWYGNKLSERTQLKYFRRTYEIEKRQTWLNNLKNFYIELIEITNEDKNREVIFKSNLRSTPNIDHTEYYNGRAKFLTKKKKLFAQISLLLDKNIPSQNNFYKELINSSENLSELYDVLINLDINSKQFKEFDFATQYDSILIKLEEKLKVVINETEDAKELFREVKS